MDLRKNALIFTITAATLAAPALTPSASAQGWYNPSRYDRIGTQNRPLDDARWDTMVDLAVVLEQQTRLASRAFASDRLDRTTLNDFRRFQRDAAMFARDLDTPAAAVNAHAWLSRLRDEADAMTPRMSRAAFYGGVDYWANVRTLLDRMDQVTLGRRVTVPTLTADGRLIDDRYDGRDAYPVRNDVLTGDRARRFQQLADRLDNLTGVALNDARATGVGWSVRTSVDSLADLNRDAVELHRLANARGVISEAEVRPRIESMLTTARRTDSDLRASRMLQGVWRQSTDIVEVLTQMRDMF